MGELKSKTALENVYTSAKYASYDANYTLGCTGRTQDAQETSKILSRFDRIF